jgi:hypothetical protein
MRGHGLLPTGIYAPMEKDINVIADVKPGEAALLIGLVERLIQDWYIIAPKEATERTRRPEPKSS